MVVADVHYLEERLKVYKRAMRNMSSSDEADMVKSYRLLWIESNKRLRALEKVLASNVDDAILRQWIPLHAKFRR